jgi:hypothetical protein
MGVGGLAVVVGEGGFELAEVGAGGFEIGGEADEAVAGGVLDGAGFPWTEPAGGRRFSGLF